MATLALAASAIALAHERVVALRDWLGGSWALVFSNPDDFAPPSTTPPGFITCIADAIRSAGVKPIAFARSLEPCSTWLDHAVNDDAVVMLDRNVGVIDMAERGLATALAALKQPFVAIVDERGKVRSTFTYRSGDRSRAMHDVMDLVAVLRNVGDESLTCPARASFSA